jgi:stage V sporulation protein R
MPQRLSPELAELQKEIEGYAKEYGLDFFETIFEVLDWDKINEVAAYGDYPARYPYWRFGMEYYALSKGYAYGLQKIYEMVINNDPCYAYLLAANPNVDQKLVMAHVYGHCDFFKNNYSFSHTNRKMVDEMANHSTRIRRYMETYGEDEVENFLDICHSLDNLIDYNAPHIKRSRREDARATDGQDASRKSQPRRLAAKEYMEDFINPEEALKAEADRIEEEQQREEHFPVKPEKDVLAFLLEHAPIANWQRTAMGIIREEAYYFAPQGRTKIMNEGWASYWHSTIMTQKALHDSELIDYADHHSGTVATQPGRLNPYKLGLELFRDIEERWNKGRHGLEWERCDDYGARRNWNTEANEGREKIFQVRAFYNDVTFIDEFLTEEFCHKHKLFVYDYNEATNQYQISSRSFDEIKLALLFQLTNFGQPWVYVRDGNFLNRGELVLWHRYEGVPIRVDYAQEVLQNLFQIWKRPVHLETYDDDRPIVMSFDGEEHSHEERTED